MSLLPNNAEVTESHVSSRKGILSKANLWTLLLCIMAITLNILMTKGIIDFSFTLLMAIWLFYSAFAILILFSFFPESKVEGKYLGFKLVGPFAGFILTWLVFYKFSDTNQYADKKYNALNKRIDSLQNVITWKTNLDNKFITDSNLIYTNKSGQKIRVRTGDISNVKDVDVWVNSENTDFQMDLFYGKSLSAKIRYLGAIKINSVIENDTIAKELNSKRNGRWNYPAGTLFETSAGELDNSNGVKKIYHIAAVIGRRNDGYIRIGDQEIEDCFVTCLKTFDSSIYTSILIPLIGTGNGNKEQNNEGKIIVSRKLVESILHNDIKQNKKVYLLAYNKNDFNSLQTALTEYGFVKQ